MGGKRRVDVREEDVTGLKYFDKLAPLLARLHKVGCQRDKAGNRKLHYDQYLHARSAVSLQSRRSLLAGHRASQRTAESSTQTRLSASLARLVERSHRCLSAGTAGVCETVAAEYSVSGSHGPDRLPVSADGFTKGWIGVPPHEKRTAQTTSQQNDRDNQVPKLVPQSNPNHQKKALPGFGANLCKNPPGGP